MPMLASVVTTKAVNEDPVPRSVDVTGGLPYSRLAKLRNVLNADTT